jgi:hypothetical protein
MDPNGSCLIINFYSHLSRATRGKPKNRQSIRSDAGASERGKIIKYAIITRADIISLNNIEFQSFLQVYLGRDRCLHRDSLSLAV